MASEGVSFLNHSLAGFTLIAPIDPIMDTASSEFKEDISSFKGLPVNDKIL